MFENRKGGQSGCNRVTEGTVAGEEVRDEGPASHWKDVAFPPLERGKLLEQHHKNGWLMTKSSEAI